MTNNTTLLDVRELQDEFDGFSSYVADLGDYNGGYICDDITEIADANTSIYYGDITEFIREYPDDVNDAINEFGWDGCGKDIYKAAQMGEFLKNERDIYDELTKYLKYRAYRLLIKNGYETITDEQNDEIENTAENQDTGEYLSTFDDKVLSIVKGE